MGKVESSVNLAARLGLSESDAQVLYFAGSLLLAFVLVVVTGCYVLVTWWLVRETQRQNRPYVYIGWQTNLQETPFAPFSLMLRNAGNRVAQGVKIAVDQDALVWRWGSRVTIPHPPNQRVFVSTVPVVAEGVSFLAPGEEKFLGATLMGVSDPQTFDYTLTYRDGAGRRYVESYSIQYSA